MSASDMSTPNPQKVEALKVWYAVFTAIIDTPQNDKDDMVKLRKLRTRIQKEAPELG